MGRAVRKAYLCTGEAVRRVARGLPAVAVDAEVPAGLYVLAVANVRVDDQRGGQRRVIDRSCSGRWASAR